MCDCKLINISAHKGNDFYKVKDSVLSSPDSGINAQQAKEEAMHHEPDHK